MLSTSAFNALLKTLEEPPPYVIFIFATTEPHKVLPTILSRCQRFDFRRIGVEETVGHLHAICGEEGVDADEASLMLIARKGDGALRDALSAFDQAIALEGTTLRYASLAAALGVVDVDLYFEASAHVRERSAAGMLGLVDRLVRRGYDLAEFVGGMQEHLRNLLVARTMPDTRLIEASAEMQARYGDEAARWAEADLLRQLALLADAEPAMRGSSQPRLRLELALLKLTALASAHDLNAALRAVERLDAHARAGGALPVPVAAAPARPSAHVVEAPAPYAAAPAPSASAPALPPPGDAPAFVRTPRPLAAQPTPTAPPPAAPSSVVGRPSSPTAPPDDPFGDEPPAAPLAPRAPAPPAARTPESAAAPAAPPSDDLTASLFGAPALRRKGPAAALPSALPSGDGAGDGSDAALSGSATLRGSTGAMPAARASAADDAARIEVRPALDPHVARAWTEIADACARPRLAACLRGARPVRIDGAMLVLTVPDAFTADTIRAASAGLLADLAERLSGRPSPSALTCTVEQAAAEPGTLDPDDPYAVLQHVKQASPAAQKLIERFGAEIVF